MTSILAPLTPKTTVWKKFWLTENILYFVLKWLRGPVSWLTSRGVSTSTQKCG